MTSVSAISDATQKDVGRRSAYFNQTVWYFTLLSIATSLLCLAAGSAIFVYVQRAVITRLKALQQYMGAQVEGRPAAISTDGQDEIAEMARATQFFVIELKKREEALARPRRRPRPRATRPNRRGYGSEARTDVERTREVLQTVLDNMTDGIVLFDKDFRLRFINNQLVTFQRYPADVAGPGTSIYRLLRFQAERGDLVLPTMSSGSFRSGWQGAQARRQSLRPAYRERPPCRIHFQAAGRGGLLVLSRDISELKKREEALAAAKEAAEIARDAAERARAEAEAANHAKSTFLATMSHEIRTPMNGVLGMVEVLERQGLNEAQRRTVSTIRDSGQALLHIIDDVLDFSKIEAGRLELEATPFSLSGLVDGALEHSGRRRSPKVFTLDAEIDAGSQDALVGDPTRVRQILFNLLSNAIKFTDRGGVRVRAGLFRSGTDARARR